MLYLHDQVWHETARDQGRLSCWLAWARQAGSVGDFINSRPGIVESATVARAGGAEIGRNRERAGCFEPIAVESQEGFRPAAQPACFESESGRLARSQGRVSEKSLHRVGAGPNSITATNMQRFAAQITAWLKAGTDTIALGCPIGQVGLEGWIGDVIGPSRSGANFDIIDQAFTDIEQADLNVHDA